ncbi:MAG TPA: hypothetical protein VNZ62_18925 [Capillimicrobium sp.]|nr:hypothetical protein [Capillimicrobium sp.]
MSDTRQPPPPPTCAVCGDVVGVYEPIVARSLDGGLVVETSLAAEPELQTQGWTCFHRACYSRSAAA